MKRTLLILWYLFLAIWTRAQNYSKTISVCSGNFTFSAAVQVDHSVHIVISDITDPTRKVEYADAGSNVSDFATIFQDQFLRITAITCTPSEKNIILTEGNKLFYQLFSSYPAPKAGLLNVSSEINLYANYIDKNGKNNTLTFKECKVQELHVEMNNGYIETIYAIVLINKVPRTYINIYGIGFTSFENYANLDGIKLVELHTKPFPKKTKGPPDFTKPIYTYIKMSELLHYFPDVEVDRRDFSPKDTAFTLNGGQNILLYKQETTKLFEAHIFSDFIGLQEDKPNGLIQTEVTKRINLNSVQWKTPKMFYFLFKSFGIIQYISPSITLSKLEQHNKRMLLGDLDSIRLNRGSNDTSLLKKADHRYTTPLDLLQHQSFSAGVDWNLLYFGNHNLKYNLYLNLGARLGITPVADSLTEIKINTITKTGSTNDFSINTLQIMPEGTITFLPEERFNFSISYTCIYIKPFSPNLQLLTFDKNDPSKYIVKRNNWLNTMELLVAYNVNQDNKLFGRIRFTSELNNFNNNFAQIQIGYSAYILGH